jgi:lipoate-protein ligase A
LNQNPFFEMASISRFCIPARNTDHPLAMFLIRHNDATDPAINLALEEYCLRSLDPGSEYLLFYINRPSIIIGRHQNPFQEFNPELARQKGIVAVRRISGGGAVYTLISVLSPISPKKNWIILKP